MKRLFCVIASIGTLALLNVIPASAAEVHVPFCGLDPATLTGGTPNCSWTANAHDVVMVDSSSVNPCTQVVGTLTSTTNSIIHTTVNGAGDVWVTSTSTGSFTFAPNSPGTPSYSGQMTFWFGASLNQNNLVFHDTGSVTAHGTDGSLIKLHMVDHLSFSATGFQNSFSIISATCP